MLILAVPALVMVLLVFLVLQFVRVAGSYTVKGTAYRYYAGQQTQLADGAVLTREADGVTRVQEGALDAQMTSLPVYYEDRQVVLLPQPMIYYAAGDAMAVRVDCFTELEYRDNGAVTAVADGREADLSRGFLYDGEDTYLFLEPMTLSFNGYRIELGAMSYVSASYQNDVMVYNRADGTMMLETPSGMVTAAAVSGDYTVSLLDDSMTLYDGTKLLLFVRPDLLDGLL